MQTVTFTNARGQSAVIGSVAPYFLTAIDGLGDLQADTQTQKAPYQDGVTYVDSLLQPRDIPITVTVYDPIQCYRYRQQLSQVFNPKLGLGVLKYEYDGGMKCIACIPDGAPTFPSGSQNRTASSQVGTIHLVAPNPYWTDELSVSTPMTAFIGKFVLPFHLPAVIGVQGSKQIFTNLGDVPTPVTILFKGPATNPVVTNLTTGEFIKINRTLADGDTLTVNTAFGNKRVEITDSEGNVTNVFNWIDQASTFWNLEVGDNEIEYSADSGQENAVVSITWQNLYVGI